MWTRPGGERCDAFSFSLSFFLFQPLSLCLSLSLLPRQGPTPSITFNRLIRDSMRDEVVDSRPVQLYFHSESSAQQAFRTLVFLIRFKSRGYTL